MSTNKFFYGRVAPTVQIQVHFLSSYSAHTQHTSSSAAAANLSLSIWASKEKEEERERNNSFHSALSFRTHFCTHFPLSTQLSLATHIFVLKEEEGKGDTFYTEAPFYTFIATLNPTFTLTFSQLSSPFIATPVFAFSHRHLPPLPFSFWEKKSNLRKIRIFSFHTHSFFLRNSQLATRNFILSPF